jgi:hypothetical protein
MQTHHIEYRISGDPSSGWQVFRENTSIGILHDLVDAVGLATQLAQYEASQGSTITQVVLDQALGDNCTAPYPSKDRP